jgi:hypothetical protein
MFKKNEKNTQVNYYPDNQELREFAVYYLTHGKDMKRTRKAHGLHLSQTDE